MSHEIVSDKKSGRAFPLKWLIYLLAILLLSAFYAYFYRMGALIDSDQAFFLRANEAILKGNPLLRHWIGSFMLMLTGDHLLGSLMRLFFSSQSIAYFYGPFIYALTVFFAFLLIKESTRDWKKTIPFLMPIILIPPSLMLCNLSIGFHGISVLYILILYWFFSKFQKENLSARFVAFYFLFLSLSSINDEWTVFFYALPVCLLLAVEVFLYLNKKDILFLGVTIAGVVCERIITTFLRHIGAIERLNYVKKFVSIRSIDEYLKGAFLALTEIFSANFSGVNLFSSVAMRCMIGLAVIGLITLGTISVFLHWKKSDRLTKAMALGLVVCFGSYAFTSLTDDPYEVNVRYLAPFYMLSLIMVARWFSTLSFSKPRFAVAFCLPLVLFSLGNAPRGFYTHPVENETLSAVARFLEAEGVENTYASYWESHSIWYYSGGKIESAPTLESIYEDEDSILPYYFMTDKSWYDSDFEAKCLVVNRDYNYGMSEEKIVHVFGDFTRHEVIDRIDIYFFDHQLQPLLEKKE